MKTDRSPSLKWYYKNKERANSNHLKWMRSAGERYKSYKRNYDRLRKHGLSASEYNEMLISQGNVCAICGKPPNEKIMAVDHDHKTGQIRGLVHRKCNLAIGLLDDDPEIIRLAADYLEKFRVY
jgi:hypothetical protein